MSQTIIWSIFLFHLTLTIVHDFCFTHHVGFYVAASPKFENVKQVRLYTFAAPRVGTTAFRNAYQYMERLGKIRHARFSCAHDIVPLVPFCNLDGYNPSRWKFYKHVGMRVQLHGTSALAKRRLERALDVTYPLCHDFLSEMKRMTVNSLLVNLNTLKGWKRKHTLTEYQRSIHFASQYRLALGKSSEYFIVSFMYQPYIYLLHIPHNHISTKWQNSLMTRDAIVSRAWMSTTLFEQILIFQQMTSL